MKGDSDSKAGQKEPRETIKGWSKISTTPQSNTAYYRREAFRLLKVMSQSASGLHDTSSSSLKPTHTSTGEPLAALVHARFNQGLDYVLASRHESFKNPDDVRRFIDEIASRVQGAAPRFRWWDLNYAPDANQYLVVLYDDFCRRLFDGLYSDSVSPLALIAWIEWEFSGQIHPFDDGVGKTSLLLTVFLLFRFNLPLPKYDNRLLHNEMLDRSYAEFLHYFISCFESEVRALHDSAEVESENLLGRSGPGIHPFVECGDGTLLPVKIAEQGLVGIVRSSTSSWR